MNDTIIYHPYRSHGWFVPFTTLIGILAFVAVGFCIPDMGPVILFLIIIGILLVYLTKVLYDSSTTVILFEREGLRIVGGTCNDCRYLPWEGFSYAYYSRNFKGHLFLVLSPKVLNPKEVKHLVNRGANLSRICIDFVVVIHIDVLQDASPLKELIANHVLHVDTY